MKTSDDAVNDLPGLTDYLDKIRNYADEFRQSIESDGIESACLKYASTRLDLELAIKKAEFYKKKFEEKL